MVAAIKANTSTTRNMGLGRSFGQTAENMSGTGRMVNSMDGESIICRMVKKRLESGWRARRLSGLRRVQWGRNDPKSDFEGFFNLSIIWS